MTKDVSIQNTVIRTISARLMIVGMLLCFLGTMAGCNEPSDIPQGAAQKSDAQQLPLPPSSSVPLRVLVVSSIRDQGLVERQWASVSDQPLKLEVISEEEFLKLPNTGSDVVLFPSHLLGELLARKWISKLPEHVGRSRFQPFGSPLSDFPTAWQKQANYDEVKFGVPLGCTSPVVVMGQSLYVQLGNPNVIDWAAVAQHLEEKSNSKVGSKPNQPEGVELASDAALVDRFLTIAFSLTNRNPRYGILFDVRTMEPQIASDSSIQAAEILCRLNQQSEPGNDMLIDDFSLWSRMQSSPSVRVAIFSPQRLLHRGLGTNQSSEKSEAEAIIPLVSNVAWNSGDGLVASITTDCQQSSQSTAFLEWLTDARTRQSLASEVDGIDTFDHYQSTEFANVFALSQKQLEADFVVQEPRLPQAHEYRQALAEQLRRMLTDEIEPTQALTQVAESWRRITTTKKDNHAREYRSSLDLAK